MPKVFPLNDGGTLKEERREYEKKSKEHMGILD